VLEFKGFQGTTGTFSWEVNNFLYRDCVCKVEFCFEEMFFLAKAWRVIEVQGHINLWERRLKI